MSVICIVVLVLMLVCTCVCYCFFLYTLLFVFSRCWFCLFFFFKQKTAYEMRISDWSSDVCSSDLECATQKVTEAGGPKPATIGVEGPPDVTEAENRFSSRFDAPNTYVKPRRAVERSTWHALPAMWFAERNGFGLNALLGRSEEHTYELQSLMRTSYAVFRLKN